MNDSDLLNSDTSNKLKVQQAELKPNPLSENDLIKQHNIIGKINIDDNTLSDKDNNIVETKNRINNYDLITNNSNDMEQTIFQEQNRNIIQNDISNINVESNNEVIKDELWYREDNIPKYFENNRRQYDKNIKLISFNKDKIITSNTDNISLVNMAKYSSDIDDSGKLYYSKRVENPIYDYSKRFGKLSFLKGFFSSAIDTIGGATNVAVRAVQFPAAFFGNLAGQVVGSGVNADDIKRTIERDELGIAITKAGEEYLKKTDAYGLGQFSISPITIKDENGKDLQYLPKESFDLIYNRIENKLFKGEDVENAKNEAFILENSLPDWQKASNKLIEIANNQIGIINSIKEANTAAWAEIEKNYIETVNANKWLISELGFDDIDENDGAYQFGSAAFSVALSLSSLFLPGLGYALPALFTTMAYDESIRHGLENGLEFKEAALRSTIPASISGGLEYLKVVSLINRSKTLKQMFFKTSLRFWADQTVQEIAQDMSVMASEEVIGLATYELANYMQTAVQDLMMTSIISVPSSIVLNRRLMSIAKRFTDRGVPIEKATRMATSIMEYGQSALNNKEFVKETVDAFSEAAVNSEYQKTLSDIDMDEDSRFDDPAFTSKRRDKKLKRNAIKEAEDIKETAGKKPQDIGKKKILKGTLKDLVGNSTRAGKLFSGKMTVSDVDNDLHEVKTQIKEYLHGIFTMEEPIANVMTESVYRTAEMNFNMSNEEVTPREFVNTILPKVVEGFALNITNGFEGLGFEFSKVFNNSAYSDAYIFKKITESMSNVPGNVKSGLEGQLLAKMSAMARYISNILKSNNKNISDIEALNYSIGYIIAKAKGYNSINELKGINIKSIGNERNIERQILKYAQKRIKTGENTANNIMGYTRYANIASDFWSGNYSALMGTTLSSEGELNPTEIFSINFEGKTLDPKKPGQIIYLSERASASSTVHEIAHSIIGYLSQSARFKINNGMALTRTETTVATIIDNFIKKYDNNIKELYKNNKNVQKRFPEYSSFQEFYINEFISTAFEYGIMKGEVPENEFSDELIELFDDIKRINNTLYYGDNVEAMAQSQPGRGGKAFSRIVKNREMYSQEKEDARRENSALADIENAIDPNGDINQDLLPNNIVDEKTNSFEKAEERFASDIYGALFQKSNFIGIMKVREDISKIIQSGSTGIKERLPEINNVINSLPDNNIGLRLKLELEELSKNKNISDMDIFMFLQTSKVDLQDMALLEGFALARSSNTEYSQNQTFDFIWKKGGATIKLFYEDLSGTMYSAVDFLPMSEENKKIAKTELENIFKKVKSTVNTGSEFIKEMSTKIDGWIDKAYENSPKFRMIVDGYNKAFIPISDLAKKLNPTLATDIKKAVFNERSMNAWLKQPLIELSKEIASNNIPNEARMNISILLKNGEYSEVKKELAKYKINRIYIDRIISRLAECKKILIDADMYGDNSIGFINNYFPRLVKDHEGLSSHIKQYSYKKSEEEQNVVEKFFGSVKTEQGDSTFTRNRKIKKVTIGLEQFYHDSLDCLSIYFDEISRIYGLYTMIGKASYRKINSVYISSIAYEDNMSKEKVAEKLVIPGNRLERVLDENTKKPYRLKLWGDIINMMGYSTGNNHKDKIIADILDAFFLRSNPATPFSIYRNVNNITTINNVFSALSNFGDLILTSYRYGFKNTLAGLVKASEGNEKATVNIEPLIENLYEEFRTDSEFFNKALDFTFKWSGFKALDLLTKRTNIESALNLLKNGNENDIKYQDAIKRLKFYFGEEIDRTTGQPLWEKVLFDIKSGIETDDVKFFVFNELSGQQPITLAEVPYYYNKYPWTRLFYQFKTFAVKQTSFFFNEIISDKFKTDPQRALKDLFTFITALLLFNVPEAVIVSFLKGESNVNIPDAAVASLAQFFMINKKAYYHIKNAEYASGVATMVLPMPTAVSRAISDASAIVGDSSYSAKSVSDIPIVGEPLRVAGRWAGNAYSYWFPAEH